MHFEDLVQFIERDMRMSHVYQPVMLRELLDRRGRASLDDIAWVLGIESSKTADVEGSRICELYQAGKLAEIREYNLNDVKKGSIGIGGRFR